MLFFIAILFLFLYLSDPAQFMHIAGWVLSLSALILTAYYFLTRAYPENPEAEAENAKRAAGLEAERHVQKVLDRHIKQCKSGLALHNKLFVFNPDAPNEYSAEVDHIFIGKYNIYAIETKFKSGQIWADADAKEWKVHNGQHESSMRNALHQVKNTARVLAKEFTLPQIIPIVAIHGTDVAIHGPSNVVSAEKLSQTILAFEEHSKNELPIEAAPVRKTLLTKCSREARHMKSHLARIDNKLKQRATKNVIENASIG